MWRHQQGEFLTTAFTPTGRLFHRYSAFTYCSYSSGLIEIYRPLLSFTFSKLFLLGFHRISFGSCRNWKVTTVESPVTIANHGENWKGIFRPDFRFGNSYSIVALIPNRAINREGNRISRWSYGTMEKERWMTWMFYESCSILLKIYFAK